MLEILYFFFGFGIWDTGLESVDVIRSEIEIARPAEKWDSFEPVVLAQSVVVMDLESAGIIYEKNANTPLPIASLTKIMTALLITENYQLSEVVFVENASARTTGASMRLEYKEKITVENLLYGLLLPSGNDAAIALAMHHSESVRDFVGLMNKRAKDLGMKNTHFTNPHGFDDEDHYSTAKDIAFLSKKFLQNSQLRKIVSTPFKTVWNTQGTVKHELRNTNILLGSWYQVKGLKTGTTPNAGECLVVLVEIKNKEYLIVILGSSDRYQDAKTLIWAIGIKS